MQQKSQTSTIKLFRRTSKSPRYLNRANQISDNDNTSSYSVTSTSSFYHTPLKQSMYNQNIISITNIGEDFGSRYTLNNFNEQQKIQGIQKNNRNLYMTGTLNKNSQDFKFTYIPLQSLTTVHTLPISQKVLIDNSYKNKQNKNIENKISKQYNEIRKQFEKLKQQHHVLIYKQKSTFTKYEQLIKQTQKLKQNNYVLENQMRKMRENLSQADKNIRISQINIDNCKRNLEVTQYMKSKVEQTNKQLRQNILDLQSQLRNYKSQNSELERAIANKQKQIKQVNYQLQKQTKKFKQILQQNQKSEDKKLYRSRAFTQQIVPALNSQQLPVFSSTSSQVFKNNSSVYVCQKFNRSVQTQTNSFQQTLKKNEKLQQQLKQKQNMIVKIQNQNRDLMNKMINHQQIVQNLKILENLVEVLNQKVIKEQILKFGMKYKYY